MKDKHYSKLSVVLFALLVFMSSVPSFGAGDEWLLDVWGSSPNSVFVVGAASTWYGPTEGNIILYWDGNAWHKMSTGVLNSLSGVWGTSNNNVYAVGAGGIVLHYDGNNWSTVVEPGTLADDLTALWGSSEINIYAVGTIYESLTERCAVILHFDGSSWRRVYIDAVNNCKWLYAIWGTSAANIFAGGGSCILHYDAYGWSKMPINLSHSISGIWGTSPTDVYAVDSYGGVYRYNGQVWTTIRDSMYDNDGGDIWCNSANDIFIVGDDPYPEPYPNYDPVIFHFDGVNFREMEYPTSNYLEAIWGSSHTDVFAVGGYGTILHFDGNSWSLVRAGKYNTLREFSPLYGSKEDGSNYESSYDLDHDGDIDGLDLAVLADKLA